MTKDQINAAVNLMFRPALEEMGEAAHFGHNVDEDIEQIIDVIAGTLQKAILRERERCAAVAASDYWGCPNLAAAIRSLQSADDQTHE